ncbi:peroxide stress protein YaaA [Streptomyces sp. ST2-7A]|uniref:peroxide stress protein YaaA n=1 Tax=Streptomyces sp. ST2-7A TaxID=2907214 RepID=UPI001F2C7753|nr:peroxide stress protein YaaA [Streptomyces sp. ST2-7A]MCE7081323.1 peroxide stress protein YaaA [Streptomyces sp. ST2-7A]
MLVLLPPSEGKAEREGDGPPLDLGSLALPGLNDARRTVLTELVELCSGDPDKAREVLGLGPRRAGEIGLNAALWSAPTLPAGELYTGVLYDALDLPSLGPEARRRAAESVLILSGPLGALRVDDRVPAHRCSVGVRLPALGGLGPFWRGPMAETMPAEAGKRPILDLRSAAYATMWKPTGEWARRTITVRVLHSRTVDGEEKRSVVSHFNKATKGRLLRDLLESGLRPADPAALVDALRELGHRVEEPGAGRLDVVVTEV